VLLSNDKSSVTSSVRTSSVAVLYIAQLFFLQYEKSKKKNHTKSIVQKVTIFYLSET